MLTIGQVAARAGLRASAIRFYEAQGLLPPPMRRGGKRLYDATILDRIAAIELAKAAGLELSEIRAAVDVAHGTPARSWNAVIKAKREQIDTEIDTLKLMKRILAGLAKCSCSSFGGCGREFSALLAKYSAKTERRRRVQKPNGRTTLKSAP